MRNVQLCKYRLTVQCLEILLYWCQCKQMECTYRYIMIRSFFIYCSRCSSRKRPGGFTGRCSGRIWRWRFVSAWRSSSPCWFSSSSSCLPPKFYPSNLSHPSRRPNRETWIPGEHVCTSVIATIIYKCENLWCLYNYDDISRRFWYI